ncbi:MAG: flagellar hook-basal body protein [Oscillospiraceae bacterium]|nr:flagellar hook-basal body protein [Oscillospiraceae bacterium]
MFKGFYNLTSGMLTQGKNLDMIANNMSNTATAGYKTDRYTFSTFEEVMWHRVGNMDRKYTDLGNQSWITAPSKRYTDFEQGAIEETGQPLDFAIEGDGFFALETADGERVYTRNGNFSLDDEGYLWLSGFGRVLSSSGEGIRLVTDRINADSSGNLFTENGGYLGTIGVFAFEDNGELDKNEYGFFVSEGEGAAAEGFTLHQRWVERANIDLVQQMTSMITAERAYQSAAEVTKIYDDVMRKSTEEVGRL